MDYQHVLAFVEAIDGADFHAIHIFATDAGFCDDIGHGAVYSPELYKPSRLDARSDRLGNPLPENAAARYATRDNRYIDKSANATSRLSSDWWSHCRRRQQPST